MASADRHHKGTTPQAITVVVRGRVQGVGYRYATSRLAAELGLVGWIRNREDGSVEILAQGAEEALAALASYLDRGPYGAVVTAVETRAVDSDPTLDHFEIRP